MCVVCVQREPQQQLDTVFLTLQCPGLEINRFSCFFFQVRCEHLVWILQPGESIFLQFRQKNDFKAFFSLVSQFETHTCGKKTKKKKFSTRLLLPSLPSLCFFFSAPQTLDFHRLVRGPVVDVASRSSLFTPGGRLANQMRRSLIFHKLSPRQVGVTKWTARGAERLTNKQTNKHVDE